MSFIFRQSIRLPTNNKHRNELTIFGRLVSAYAADLLRLIEYA